MRFKERQREEEEEGSTRFLSMFFFVVVISIFLFCIQRLLKGIFEQWGVDHHYSPIKYSKVNQPKGDPSQRC
jgi:hypothetical protein